jgi:probable phosphoglycerate mutase
MALILLTRHGETDWNLRRRVQGHTDIPLNTTGLAQAAALAEELQAEPLVAVFSSDLARARATAATIADRHGLLVSFVPDLRE